jgi:glucose-1-phosphate thymidylyltransferase
MRTQQVEVWLDGGTPDALLETNRYLLENGSGNYEEAKQRQELVVIPPVFIHPSATVRASIIGPNVSIGADCDIEHSIIRDSILEDEAEACGITIEKSLIGRRVSLKQRTYSINAGDNTEISL